MEKTQLMPGSETSQFQYLSIMALKIDLLNDYRAFENLSTGYFRSTLSFA